MNFPLIPKAEAMALLEDAMHADEARGEFLAEQGSSYLYGGASSIEATWAANRDWNEREQDFLSSPEGQEYTEKMEAARLYDELPGVLSDDMIPELMVTADGLYPSLRTSYDHSLFRLSANRFQTSPDPDDIPF